MSTTGSRVQEATRAGTVALVGRPNVGKSSLLNALIGEPIAITSSHPQTTRETVRGVLTRDQTQYILLDSPGLHLPRTQLGQRMNEAARMALRDADVALLLVEAPSRQDGHTLSDGDWNLAEELRRIPTVLVINKIDRLKDKARLLPFMQAISARERFVATVPVSVKAAEGLTQLLEEVRPLLPQQPWLFDTETLSDQPIRFFVAEFVREQILRHAREEVPHGVAVVVERFDEDSQPAVIEMTIHAARQAHKKILIGAGGQMIKRITLASQRRIERLLSRKVQLQLRVRVNRGWMDDDERLGELGFRQGKTTT